MLSLAFLWTVFAAEMFLRAFDPQSMLPRYVQAGNFGIRVNVPNKVYTHHTPDYTVEIRTNSKGIRASYDFSYDKQVGVKRIVVLSDSFGMGYGVSFDQSFTEQMRRQLEKNSGHKVEIINLSVSGFGTAEELLMLRHEGIKYYPDLVLLTWHETDLDDNIRSGLFTLENGKLMRKNTTYLPGVKIREFLFSFASYRWLAGNSDLYNWARRRASSTIKRLMVSSADEKKSDNLGAQHVREKKIMLALALMKAINREAEKAGAKFMVLEIPNRASRTNFLPSLPDEIRKRFEVVSPIAAFKQHSGSLLYWEKSEGHFTPLGCRLVADELVKNIEEFW